MPLVCVVYLYMYGVWMIHDVALNYMHVTYCDFLLGHTVCNWGLAYLYDRLKKVFPTNMFHLF